jgi:hypothetical protein
MRAKPTIPVRLAVNDGQVCVGHVEMIDGHWHATDVAGKIVGTFTTQKDAVRALPALGVFDHA